MTSFRVPREDQQKVLLFGIVFSLIARTGFILLGAALISSFAWVFYLFGLILLLTAGSMLKPEGEESHTGDNVVVRLARKVIHSTDHYDGDKLFTMHEGRRALTPMLLVMVAIGGTDILFALDSIPAIFGLTQNTYIVFTSDNGFHLGQHRLGAGKWTPYEEDIRIPLIVRGPGVPEGERLPHMVLNNDLAPTFADLAGAEPPSFVDGRSLVPLLTEDPTPLKDWRQRFVIESVAERSGVPHPPFITESTVVPLLTGDPLPGNWRRTSAASAQSSEEWGRPWLKALRTNNYLYVDYKTGEHELYDLGKDPYELNNMYATAPPEITQRLEAQLDALRQCSAAQCHTAESDQPGKPPDANQPSVIEKTRISSTASTRALRSIWSTPSAPITAPAIR